MYFQVFWEVLVDDEENSMYVGVVLLEMNFAKVKHASLQGSGMLKENYLLA